MDAYQNPKGKSPCFLANTTFFSTDVFFMKKLKLKKKVEYSFDAELSYLSIGGIFRAIRAAQTALEQFEKTIAQKPSKMYI